MSQLPDDPSIFFSSHLSPPFPTNSFFRNLLINYGNGPVDIHPFTIRSLGHSLNSFYKSKKGNVFYDIFKGKLGGHGFNISSLGNHKPNLTHTVSSFDDLSVTLDLTSNLRFFLVRGSPFLTFAPITGTVRLHLSFYLAFSKVSCNDSHTKYTIKGINDTCLLYSSLPINFEDNYHNFCTILISDEFSGIIRIAMLTNSSTFCKEILDHSSSCYPVSGEVEIKRFHVEYKWEKRGEGDLLMLAHPLHVRLLSPKDCEVTLLEDFKYQSMDGELVGVVGDSWVLKINPFPITWFSSTKVCLKKESYDEIQNAISKDVETTCGKEISIRSPFLHGLLIIRAARLVVIAAELGYSSIIPTIEQFLKDKIEPLLDGTYGFNDFWYNETCTMYFLYVISVLTKIDPVWGRKYKLNAYTLMASFIKFDKGANSTYPRPSCFDLWTLHPRDRGLGDNADKIDFKMASEASKAYYSAALLGLAYEDTILFDMGSTLLALEIYSTKTIIESQIKYFIKNVKSSLPEIISNVRDNLLPLLPITEALFSNVRLVEELTDTLMHHKQLKYLPKNEVMEVVSALEAIYDKEGALEKVRKLKLFDDRNSLTNLLWWIHSGVDIPHHFRHSLTWPTSGCKVYKYKELEEATKGFHKILGSGGFATVYKGVLRDGREVAVKLLRNSGGGGDHDFWREVEIVSRIKHRCLVRFFGYCIYEQQRLLVYDYVPNNTLHDHIHGRCSGIMAWEKRVRVAFCVACGIEYLHHYCGDQIIHRDIKSNNILLDNEFNAQVADFGFAKSAPNERTVSASRLAGTWGYFAPEYAMYGTFTEKSDVYSFGVVLLELITGREPLASEINMIEWARPLLKKPISNINIQKLVDPMLENNFVDNEMIWMIETAADCMSYSPSERPKMSEVVSVMRQHGRISGMEPDNVEPDVTIPRGIIFL